MILPKHVWDLLINEQMVKIPHLEKPYVIQLSVRSVFTSEESEKLVDWIFAHENQHPCLVDWLSFLRRYREAFSGVAQGIGYWNEQSSHSLGHDKWTVGWAGDAMLPIANALYTLKSFGVCGAVLECGAFKGSSTACLSLVCAELGFDLDCADSFEGLPSEEGHYVKGDFFGTLEEVRRNVSRFGNIERVNFIEGWYSETLNTYDKPLALLWIDVDLQISTIDVLENIYNKLAPGALIFSDGFSEGVDFDGNQVVETGGEPAGFYHFFKDNKINYCAAAGGSKGLALITPRSYPEEDFLIPPDTIKYLIGCL